MRANPLLGLMAIAGVILAIVIGLEIAFGASLAKTLDASEKKRGVPADAKLLPALVAIGPEQAYPETVARPLFIPTRRPAPDAPAAAQASLMRGQFVLQGTIVVGDQRVAMLREKSTGKVHRIERGKDFNGMKVVSIEKEFVTLGVGTDEEKLVLNVLKPPPGPAPAAPTAASSGPFAPPPTAGAMPIPGKPPAPNPNAPPGATPAAPGGANPAAQPMPQVPAAAAAPLTPEEAIARRRAARRSQQQ